MQEKNKSLKNTLYCDESIKTIINPVNLNFDDTVLEKAFVKKETVQSFVSVTDSS